MTRNFYCLNTSPLHKQNWKKLELERRSWSKVMKISREIWSNKQKRQTRWWNRWWKCSRNKPNLSCTPLAYFISVVCIFAYVFFWTYVYMILNYCFWSMLMCLWTICVLLNIHCFWTMCLFIEFSHYAFLISFFLPIFYTFCWWQKGE